MISCSHWGLFDAGGDENITLLVQDSRGTFTWDGWLKLPPCLMVPKPWWRD